MPFTNVKTMGNEPTTYADWNTYIRDNLAYLYSITTPTTAKARAYRNVAYTPGTAGWVKVPLDAETYDPGNNFDSTTNRRFVAPVTGYYAVSGAFAISNATAGDLFFIGFYVDGTIYSIGDRGVVAAGEQGFSGSDIIYMAANSYVELWVYSSTARAFAAGTLAHTYMSVHLLSTA